MHDDDTRPGLNRRSLLQGIAGFAALGAASVLTPARAQRAQNSAVALPDNPAVGTLLVLLGTRGGPGVDLTRAQSSSAVVVDGVPYLVDCGYGTLRSLVASGLTFTEVGTTFLTHLHDDHTSDLPALMAMQWTGNRRAATGIYGPYGTQALVAAAVEFLRANAEIRIVDEGRTGPPTEVFRGYDIPATAEPTEAFKDERVRVTAAENTHFPERFRNRMPHRSLSYRFDTADRSIVFSGDTAYSENLVRLARNADVLVCEVLAEAVFDSMNERAREAAAEGNEESIFRHIAETHVTPTVVGQMAAEARVKSVVLNHQIHGAREGALPFPTSKFVAEIGAHFSGPVIVGHDLMVL